MTRHWRTGSSKNPESGSRAVNRPILGNLDFRVALIFFLALFTTGCATHFTVTGPRTALWDAAIAGSQSTKWDILPKTNKDVGVIELTKGFNHPPISYDKKRSRVIINETIIGGETGYRISIDAWDSPSWQNLGIPWPAPMERLELAESIYQNAIATGALNCVKPLSVKWKVDSSGGKFRAYSGGYQFKAPLMSDCGAPRLLEWKIAPENSAIGLLIYDAGTASTHSKSRMTRAVVIDITRGKVLADEPIMYQATSDRKPLAQPEWIWEKGQLTISDPAFGRQLIVKLSPDSHHQGDSD